LVPQSDTQQGEKLTLSSTALVPFSISSRQAGSAFLAGSFGRKKAFSGVCGQQIPVLVGISSPAA
jgi:hypothetical protein